MNNVSKELLVILRHASIGILDIRTAESLASDIVHTLNKLKQIYLRGTYTGRCDLRLPASLQCISLQKVECSTEWLCSLLITLSSLDHPVRCNLVDIELQSSKETRREESYTHVSDLRSEFLSRDMSNIEIVVDKVSKELFEILRDTSIEILLLKTADGAACASEILHTLQRLKKLYLMGTFTGRCEFKLPVSLQYINLQKSECSSEWLRSLFFTLSSVPHPVRCDLMDVVLQQSEEARENESHIHVSDLGSEKCVFDRSNIEILVQNGSK
ncbi:hypothetical protein DPMN_061152 [Dreissena polymorpha]|uniref:Uncharacterized protein n=1 Tax=Dreissena polymorpha TaxID=45954 RepID=A0A9D4C7F0_DREPO|nr:hypothetical protein DPMN_061152 [Dreissena polymorpha]